MAKQEANSKFNKRLVTLKLHNYKQNNQGQT